MIESVPLSIVALGDPTDRAAMLAAGEQLGEALCDDAGRPWPVQVTVQPPDAAVGWAPGTIVVASLQADLVPIDRPMAGIEAAWRERMERWNRLAPSVVVLCTMFRHVDDEHARQGLVERIRRLNRLVISLSRDYGAFVADIDRTFTMFGAKALQTDYRLGGRVAAEAAAHTIVANLLAGDLGGEVSTERQASGASRHGTPYHLASVVERRLQMRGNGDAPQGFPSATERLT